MATDGDNNNDGSESAPWKTIQYAFTTIPTSGTIMVKDGTYTESITFPSDKVITLKSVNGASSTTIIGDDDSATVTCINSPEGTTLEGFTISHKSVNSGRGITTTGYLTINNCTISHNSANDGGGIDNKGTLTINGSTIYHNSADNDGGGISNKGTLTIEEDSTVSDNSADNDGGGIYNKGTLTINGSTISSNSAGIDGGGISNKGTLTITGSTILGNKAVISGGGIYLLKETNVTIGGSSDADLDNFNNFINNYKEGNDPSADQHIRNASGDCHANYPNNNFDPSP